MRKRLSEHSASEVLYKNRHSCCICHDRNKDVQIHHIDGNNTNDALSNLAVLCLDCHSKVTGQRGLGKRFSADEVKKYKNSWERKVEELYGLSKRWALQFSRGAERSFFLMEAKRLIYEMTSASDSQKDVIYKNFENLNLIGLYEDLSREIIYNLQLIFGPSAIKEFNKPIALAEYLPQFFLYLVGPDKVPLSKRTEASLVDAIETIRFAHNMTTDRNKRAPIMRSFVNSLKEFVEIGISYKRHKIFQKGMMVIAEIRVSCSSVLYKDDHLLNPIVRLIDRYIDNFRKTIKDSRLPWNVDCIHRHCLREFMTEIYLIEQQKSVRSRNPRRSV